MTKERLATFKPEDDVSYLSPQTNPGHPLRHAAPAGTDKTKYNLCINNPGSIDKI